MLEDQASKLARRVGQGRGIHDALGEVIGVDEALGEPRIEIGHPFESRDRIRGPTLCHMQTREIEERVPAQLRAPRLATGLMGPLPMEAWPLLDGWTRGQRRERGHRAPRRGHGNVARTFYIPTGLLSNPAGLKLSSAPGMAGPLRRSRRPPIIGRTMGGILRPEGTNPTYIGGRVSSPAVERSCAVRTPRLHGMQLCEEARPHAALER